MIHYMPLVPARRNVINGNGTPSSLAPLEPCSQRLVGQGQHKARRAALNRFFSMVSVRRLQPVVKERVQRLIERFRGFKETDGEVKKIDYAFAAFTNGGLLSFRAIRPGLLLKF